MAARTTQWSRFAFRTDMGSTSQWSAEGPGFLALPPTLGPGHKILRAMVKFQMFSLVTNNDVTTVELPYLADAANTWISVGMWTDIYNVGQGPSDALEDDSDPGWIMRGQMVAHHGQKYTLNGLIQQYTFVWDLAPTLRWDVERTLGPAPAGADTTVYWVWNSQDFNDLNLFGGVLTSPAAGAFTCGSGVFSWLSTV